jgi:hypothetical protein
MAKKVLTGCLIVALIILGAGLYLGHNGINKLENSYNEAMNKQNSVAKKLQEENQRLSDELKKAQEDKVAAEAELKKQSDLVSSLLKQSQEALVMEGQVKALSDKLQQTVDSCQIRPKPLKKVVVVHKAPVPERIIIKEVEKPAKPQTIVINKIFIQEGKNKPKLIKEDRKVLPEAYPNDLLK